jgi:hypothetical protein
MQRFASVLALVGDGDAPGETCALAVEIARADRAALTFVDVIAEAAVPDSEIAARREALVEAVAAADFAGITATEALLHGDPAVEVIRMVLREGHDLVLVGQGAGAETVARLLADCPCPVLRVGQGRPAGVVALMPEGGGPEAALVTRMAEALSRAIGGAAAAIAAGDAEGRVRAQEAGAVLVVTAREVALAGVASVLAIKPEDFVSPVTLEAAPQDKDARIAVRGKAKG